ncbi:hypothetical protein QYF36_012231 [Acer negundo]|nr:hypothetical protein QYF36_012231 [Acer negundo]
MSKPTAFPKLEMDYVLREKKGPLARTSTATCHLPPLGKCSSSTPRILSLLIYPAPGLRGTNSLISPKDRTSTTNNARHSVKTTTARAFPSPIRKDTLLGQSHFPEEARSSKRKKEETKSFTSYL